MLFPENPYSGPLDGPWMGYEGADCTPDRLRAIGPIFYLFCGQFSHKIPTIVIQ